jgi:ribosomal protein L11 methyltransferase
MTGSAWTEISCTVPDELVDSLADFLVELTGTGVSVENLTVDTFNAEEIADAPVKTVKAYVPDDDAAPALVARLSAFLAGQAELVPGYTFSPPTTTVIRDEDWATSWKVHFKPARIGRQLVIKPSWEEYQAAATDVVLELDPGMAFGTGTHHTTRLCLEALEDLFAGRGPAADARLPAQPAVLDVGCGSGVLSIAAAKLGACRVVAVDIDPVAVQVTEENAVLNGVAAGIEASTTPLAGLAGTFDVILANILAEELVRLAAELTGRLAPGGFLILSGILREREEYVREGFASQPLTPATVSAADDWCCLVFRRLP